LKLKTYKIPSKILFQFCKCKITGHKKAWDFKKFAIELNKRYCDHKDNNTEKLFIQPFPEKKKGAKADKR